jgi:serine/threonine protein kinase
VYEYCPGKTLRDWADNVLLQAAQQPQVQQQQPAAAAAVLADLSLLDATKQEWWNAKLLSLSMDERRVWKARQVCALRQAVLEQPLKQHMLQLLRLVVQMHHGDSNNSSSFSSSGGSKPGPSATKPPGGLVFHNDIKSGNIYIAEDGSAKLGDWGMAMYIPDASSQQQLLPPGYTLR